MPTTYAGDPNTYPAAVRHAQDGDSPSETVMIAPMVHDLADRTAALKDGDLTINGDKIYGNEQTFNGGATINTLPWDFNADVQFDALVDVRWAFLISGMLRWGPLALADANAAIAADAGSASFRYIPRVLTGNRIYTLQDSLPIPAGNAMVLVARMSAPGPTAPSAHTCTFRRQSGPTNLLSFPASQPAWALFSYGAFEAGSDWFVVLASANCTYL